MTTHHTPSLAPDKGQRLRAEESHLRETSRELLLVADGIDHAARIAFELYDGSYAYWRLREIAEQAHRDANALIQQLDHVKRAITRLETTP